MKYVLTESVPPQVTFQKTSTGNFAVLVDGKPSGYGIINGSLGLSGRNTPNVYGITKGSTVRWVGSLVSAKKMIVFTLTKKG